MSIVDEDYGYRSDSDGTIEATFEGALVVLTWKPRKENPPQHEVLRYDRAQGLMTLHPRAWSHGTFDNQFDRIKEIQIELPSWEPDRHSEFSDRMGSLHAVGLPRGFKATYSSGLGIGSDYTRLIHEIESRTDCTTLRLTQQASEHEGPEGDTFTVTLALFADFVAAVKRNKGRSTTALGRVLRAEAQNALADLLHEAKVEPAYARNEVINNLTREIAYGHVTTPSDRALLLEAASNAAAEVARESPSTLVRLRNDIELVSLEALVTRFEADLKGGHATSEPHWQAFFDQNQFALQLVFSMPTVIRSSQAPVAPAGHSGTGARIADYLAANITTRTAVIVEIKTPSTKLMRSGTPYRGESHSKVYAPHNDMAGAVAQVQSQMVSLREHFKTMADDTTRDLNVASDLRSALIIGRFDSLEGEQRDSFLRYREGTSNVEILCYDELLDRLKELLKFLRHRDDEA